ncbi:2'-5' RNA ligase family protein [Isoptericola sp. QY 916]|uniref:2'-5' RNA ligase family protein n=1 Tax=Isoptericola sp. QY 916 TaxID=2782570 RepID=UPI003D2FA348|nr:2'-5' RNA ligase family protein [Isoptericola sp. QY 916]
MNEASERFAAGQTALVVVVPEAEPVVGVLRSDLDTAAAYGVPAHVTVLFPFLPVAAVDAAVLDALRDVVGAHAPFDATFAGCGRFPGVLYLVPEPDASWRALLTAVAARFPEAPPYGGAFDDVVPHLTVADGQGPEALDDAEAAVAPRLPVRTRVREVALLVFDGERWRRRADFPLSPDTPGAAGP